MGQKGSRAEFVNLSREFVDDVLDSFGNDANKVHDTLRDWPLCICARRGNYREMLALLKRGADASKKSLLDGRTCVELAVHAQSAVCVWQLYEYGARAVLEDALVAAQMQNCDMMRVILSRLCGYPTNQIVASVLFGGEEKEETARALQCLDYTQESAEFLVIMCINKRFWFILRRMLDWFEYKTSGRGRMGRRASESVLGNLGEMPGALREKIVVACSWTIDELRVLAKWLSYGVLMKVIQGMCGEMDDMLDKWRLWQAGLDESNLCAVHWICAQGDYDSLVFALDNEGSVHSVSSQGNTPMHMVTGLNESTACLRLLLERGADPECKNQANVSCRDMWRLLKREDWMALVKDEPN